MVSSVLLLQPKIAPNGQDLLYFHMHFRIFFSLSVKNAIEIFMRTVLNL